MARDTSSRKGRLAAFALVPVRAFFATLALFLLAGGLLAAVSLALLGEVPSPWPWVAVALAVVESAAAGVMVGTKQAAARSVAFGLASLNLGRTLVRLVFERVTPALGDAAARLPLSQAEAKLKDGVAAALAMNTQGGAVRKWVQARLIAAVERYTLTRFRAGVDGVDLAAVQTELEDTIDARLAGRILTGARVWSLAAFVVLAAVVVGQTLALRGWLTGP